MAEALELSLTDGSVNHDIAANARMQRERRVQHRAAGAAATRAPDDIGETERRNSQRLLEHHGLLSFVGKGAETINLVGIDPGIRGSGENRLATQLELAVGCAAMARVSGLANANNGNLIGKGSAGVRHGGLAGLGVRKQGESTGSTSGDGQRIDGASRATRDLEWRSDKHEFKAPVGGELIEIEEFHQIDAIVTNEQSVYG